METTYKGFTIRLLGHPLKSKDWEVFPVGKEDEIELYESMDFEDVKDLIDTLVN